MKMSFLKKELSENMSFKKNETIEHELERLSLESSIDLLKERIENLKSGKAKSMTTTEIRQYFGLGD